MPRQPKDFEAPRCGGPTDSVYRQTISAYNQRMLTLAGAGLRGDIEGVCKEKGIKGGNVKDKSGTTKRSEKLDGRINGLSEKGHITNQQAESLHEIRFLGNMLRHELYQPSASEHRHRPRHS